MKQSYLKIYIILSLLCFLFALPSAAKEKKQRDFTVVVDAGHGGKDIGATDNKAREKDINLGVALQLQKLIKKKLKDADVVMTRDKDTYLTLQQRADVANQAKGDLFISIHTNSVDKSNKNRKTVAGSSVYVLGLHKDENNMRVARRENSVIELESNFEQKYSGFDPSKDESYIIFEMAQKKNLSKSIKFAEEAQRNLVKSGRANRGVHQAGFWVLWATSMPSVLIELDFICNPKSAAYMTSEKGQKELAESIFKAVENYYKGWQKTTNHKNGKKDVAESEVEENIEAEPAAVAADFGDDGKIVIASTKTVTRKVAQAPAASKASSGYATGKRRRRSLSAKKVSDARNVETASIPLHSESERKGRVVELASVSDSDVKAAEEIATEEPKSKKGKKKKDKKGNKEKKNKEKIKKSKRAASAHNAKIEKFVTVYKIQVLASADLLKQNNPRFCGLTPISAYKENNLYKYYYGESQDRDEIDKLLKDVKKKIPDAFVVSSMKSKNNAKN